MIVLCVGVYVVGIGAYLVAVEAAYGSAGSCLLPWAAARRRRARFMLAAPLWPPVAVVALVRFAARVLAELVADAQFSRRARRPEALPLPVSPPGPEKNR